MTSAFSTLPISSELLATLEALGYQEMTPVQQQSLPHILNNKDLLAQAKTGSGKTVAFAIGLLSKLNATQFNVQALVMCPTRELADQVSKEIRRLARGIPNVKILMLCGGKAIGPQIGSLEHGAHIVVGTPGRIRKHLQKGTLQLHDLQTMVLDEADRMLDMGFYEDMNEIFSFVPPNTQTLLFSATYPESIKEISEAIQQNPVNVTVEHIHTESHIKQFFYEVQNNQRNTVLIALLSHYRPESTIVFCRTKKQTREVAEYLKDKGFEALALHGDLEQNERDQVLVCFANHSSSILVATDVAARGLDVKDLQAVINYELAHDPEVHIHRIGRTGRAGQEGLALSLFAADEAPRVNAIADYQKQAIVSQLASSLKMDDRFELQPPMITLCIDGGRKTKLRPGDILGALTGDAGIKGSQVGKIDIFDNRSYVAIDRQVAKKALCALSEGKIKGRKIKVRRIR